MLAGPYGELRPGSQTSSKDLRSDGRRVTVESWTTLLFSGLRLGDVRGHTDGDEFPGRESSIPGERTVARYRYGSLLESACVGMSLQEIILHSWVCPERFATSRPGIFLFAGHSLNCSATYEIRVFPGLRDPDAGWIEAGL